MKNFVSLSMGFLFAIGLGVSGMVKPQVVRGFLDIFGSWNPMLMGVMVGAIAVHGIAYRFILKRPSPLIENKFYLPTVNDIDKRLLIGSAIFGLGWGWAGVCPGPGFVSLASGEMSIALYIVSLLVGMKTFQLVEAKFSK